MKLPTLNKVNSQIEKEFSEKAPKLYKSIIGDAESFKKDKRREMESIQLECFSKMETLGRCTCHLHPDHKRISEKYLSQEVILGNLKSKYRREIGKLRTEIEIKYMQPYLAKLKYLQKYD